MKVGVKQKTRKSGATWHRIISYGVPPVALAAALAIHISGLSVDEGMSGFRVLVGALSSLLMLTTVFVVAHHAEALARQLGEPYGTLLLTAAVTTIEVSIIVSMMLHGDNNPTLARESVFSTVMITLTGVVGVCLTVGGWKYRKQAHVREGTSAYLAVLIALTVLTLILPTYTRATDPGTFSTAQLAFVSTLSVLLYASFVFAQTIRHRDDFIEQQSSLGLATAPTLDGRAVATNALFMSTGLLGIVLLAQQVAGGIENVLVSLQVTQSDAIVGSLIAMLVLLPEGVAAIRAGMRNQLQRSLNIAMGSACATIGLTIPVVAFSSLITGRGLTLGLPATDTVLLILALSVSTVSFGSEKTTFLTGLVHIVIFLSYILLIFIP